MPDVVVYDDLSHSKKSKLIFLNTLLIFLLQCDAEIIPVRSASSSKFKNRLLLFETKYNLKVRCNFFSSRHEKGPADGIAVTIKILAANIVTSREGVLTDYHSFVKAAESSSIVKKIHVTN